jgi:ATP-dependent RNA helicase DDX51/DBP6
VLPTRDLVLQVRDVFEQFSRGTGLKIGTATGQHSFGHEQSTLVGDLPSSSGGGSSLPQRSLQGGNGKIDILVCTPGRLMDHLKATPGFSLQHLRFLVIDEADRLLNQSFNDWLKTILSHIEIGGPSALSMPDEQGDGENVENERIVPDAVAPALLQRAVPFPRTDLDVKLKPSVSGFAVGVASKLTCFSSYRRRSCSFRRHLHGTQLGSRLFTCTIRST